MKNYAQKMAHLLRRQSGNCAIAADHDSYEAPEHLHHRLHNTKTNRKKYPLLVDSLWNLAAVSSHWHMRYSSWGKIGPYEAGKREAFLRRHPKIAAAINMEDRNGFLDELAPSDLPDYTNVLFGTFDRSRHPSHLLRGRVSGKPAMGTKHKKPPAGDNKGGN